MIRRLLVLSVSVAALLCAGMAVAQDAAMIEKGKAVFDAAKPACKACHNEKTAPLDKFGATGTADDVKAWIRTPKEMFKKTGKTGLMPVYADTKMSDEDLDALAAYLTSLK